ncbi:uridine kinase [Sediminihabitans luteus]|uniref:Uridine kinase n=1 Tax=Sediminihabitans luteus TaxID=1138585 RepID=A0A2M9CCM5_9CELL|nr:(d)CMP kinase [Sediminihabitans luteus]PJJ69135.1 uridine kinase [Sediminihabitans luteus]GII99521.1 adenylate kinase [Sediminihabitans luteus]
MSVAPEVLATLVARAHASAPLLPGSGAEASGRVRPGTRLVCVDGPSGSGKSTLASQLAVALDAQVVHMDDLYEGWEAGPSGGAERLATWVLGPLAAGLPGRYRRYDWVAGEYAEEHDVPLAPFVVVEGCGAGALVVEGLASLLVWVEADDAERLRRGLERDGAAAREHWLRWMQDEAVFYPAQRTRERADVRIDGWGRLEG